MIGIFQAACTDLGEIAKTAKLDPENLADQTFQALTENDYGQYDEPHQRSDAGSGAEGTGAPEASHDRTIE